MSASLVILMCSLSIRHWAATAPTMMCSFTSRVKPSVSSMALLTPYTTGEVDASLQDVFVASSDDQLTSNSLHDLAFLDIMKQETQGGNVQLLLPF